LTVIETLTVMSLSFAYRLILFLAAATSLLLKGNRKTFLDAAGQGVENRLRES
jgi:hypothetical protein